ncbi:unnamed protein product [Ascophyllum nodosum]
MGSGAAPKYEGFEAKVRAVMPKDEHLVVGIAGFYVGLYGLFKVVSAMFSSPKKKLGEIQAPAAAASAPTSDSEIPTGGDDFYKWLEGEDNMEKYLATIEKAK